MQFARLFSTAASAKVSRPINIYLMKTGAVADIKSLPERMQPLTSEGCADAYHYGQVLKENDVFLNDVLVCPMQRGHETARQMLEVSQNSLVMPRYKTLSVLGESSLAFANRYRKMVAADQLQDSIHEQCHEIRRTSFIFKEDNTTRNVAFVMHKEALEAFMTWVNLRWPWHMDYHWKRSILDPNVHRMQFDSRTGVFLGHEILSTGPLLQA